MTETSTHTNICDICSCEYYKGGSIECVECLKSVCGLCYNKIRSPFNCDKLNSKITDEKTKLYDIDETAELTANYKCPFCRTTNDIEIINLDKKILSKLLAKEYSIWTIEKNEREDMRTKNINLKYENNNLRKALELKSDYDKQSKGIYTETDYYNQAFIAVNNQLDRLQSENIKLNERNDILLNLLNESRRAENENIHLKYRLKVLENQNNYFTNCFQSYNNLQNGIREIATSCKSLKQKVKAIEAMNNNANNTTATINKIIIDIKLK